MSRMGGKPIKILDNVTVNQNGRDILVKGKNGENTVSIPINIEASIKDGEIILSRKNNAKLSKALHGVTRKLLINAIQGVCELFQKQLDIVGVGYRVAQKGDNLELNVGYSNPVTVEKPANIFFKVQKNSIIVSGNDKQKVGEVAAKIRAIRPPEPYKGKGIKYSDEIIKRKSGKAAKAAGASAK